MFFNFNSEFFKDREFRKAVSYLFDYNAFKDLAFSFALSANQFVSSGVLGYNTAISYKGYDVQKARSIIDELFKDRFTRVSLTFDYPANLESIGAYIKNQFKLIGVDVVLNPLNPVELDEKIKSGKSDFYYFGWKSELGDSIDFLKEVVHSRDKNGFGVYNGMNYSNSKVDELIEKSDFMMDLEVRGKLMQDVMKIIVDDDVIGVPLFESKAIYAFNKSVKLDPRIDGYIFATDVM